MKRRWAWNIFCAFSLLIFAADTAVLVRSFLVTDSFYRNDRQGIKGNAPRMMRSKTEGIAIDRGVFVVFRMCNDRAGLRRTPDTSGYDSTASAYKYGISNPFHAQRDVHLLGFRWVETSFSSYGSGFSFQMLQFPLWLFLIFAVPPLVWWRQRGKRLGPAQQGGRGFPLAAEGSQAADLNEQAS